MSTDLTCPTCNGGGKVAVADVGEWIEAHCRQCDGSGRRLPELYEWDAQVEVKRTLRIDLARAEAERDRMKEPIDLTAVYETIDCDWPVPRCLGVAGWLRWHDEHGWLSVCGRHVRDDLDPKGGETL